MRLLVAIIPEFCQGCLFRDSVCVLAARSRAGSGVLIFGTGKWEIVKRAEHGESRAGQIAENAWGGCREMPVSSRKGWRRGGGLISDDVRHEESSSDGARCLISLWAITTAGSFCCELTARIGAQRSVWG